MRTRVNRVLTQMASIAIVTTVFAVAVPRDVRATIINVPSEYPTIQEAIDAAGSGDTVQVAAGTYYEQITMKQGVVILGAGEDVTTIDGGGSGPVVTASYVDSTARLEGFTITNGSADKGGGIYIYNPSPPGATNSPTVTNCTFSGNSATTSGGGMYNSFSNPTVTNCTFSGNSTVPEGAGAGMYNYCSSPTVTNCTFSGNSSGRGGGMSNYGDWFDSPYCNPTVTNCIFSGNSANSDGGGMWNSFSKPTVTNCTFSNNSAVRWGGGMWNSGISLALTNCTFSGNSAGEYGGGIWNHYKTTATVTNCVLWGDMAGIDGGEIALRSKIYPSTLTISYSDVQGGAAGAYVEANCTLNWDVDSNIDADPMFADAEGRLLAFSPCLDAGNDDAVPPGVTTDLDGNPRIQGVCVDMGAFESDLNYMDPGWVFMIPDAPDFGYSLNEADLLYFYSFDFLQSFNLVTGGWSVYMPTDWVYFDWPFYYELVPGTLWFALPPESGIGVYHFSTNQWEVLPRIIP